VSPGFTKKMFFCVSVFPDSGVLLLRFNFASSYGKHNASGDLKQPQGLKIFSERDMVWTQI